MFPITLLLSLTFSISWGRNCRQIPVGHNWEMTTSFANYYKYSSWKWPAWVFYDLWEGAQLCLSTIVDFETLDLFLLPPLNPHHSGDSIQCHTIHFFVLHVLCKINSYNFTHFIPSVAIFNKWIGDTPKFNLHMYNYCASNVTFTP